jgi:hypothetical protein
MFATEELPFEILQRASLRDKEYAWPVDEIPAVIEAARKANFVNVGGQLQFRFPDAICECYWIEVDTYKLVSSDLPWLERVEKTASAAVEAFGNLQRAKDFLKEGRSFEHVSRFEAEGGSLNAAMCFVWYVEAHSARDFVR